MTLVQYSLHCLFNGGQAKPLCTFPLLCHCILSSLGLGLRSLETFLCNSFYISVNISILFSCIEKEGFDLVKRKMEHCLQLLTPCKFCAGKLAN